MTCRWRPVVRHHLPRPQGPPHRRFARSAVRCLPMEWHPARHVQLPAQRLPTEERWISVLAAAVLERWSKNTRKRGVLPRRGGGRDHRDRATTRCRIKRSWAWACEAFWQSVYVHCIGWRNCWIRKMGIWSMYVCAIETRYQSFSTTPKWPTLAEYHVMQVQMHARNKLNDWMASSVSNLAAMKRFVVVQRNCTLLARGVGSKSVFPDHG